MGKQACTNTNTAAFLGIHVDTNQLFVARGIHGGPEDMNHSGFVFATSAGAAAAGPQSTPLGDDKFLCALTNFEFTRDHSFDIGFEMSNNFDALSSLSAHHVRQDGLQGC
jgi:hypothetical protein